MDICFNAMFEHSIEELGLELDPNFLNRFGFENLVQIWNPKFVI